MLNDYEPNDEVTVYSPLAGRALTSLSDQIWERLSMAIVQGHIQPGERLVEQKIAAQMGTSQAPVREALQRLEVEGLVERRSRSATFVTEMAMDEMFELSSIRSLIESFAIHRTAQIITPQQCDELQLLVEKMRGAARASDIVSLVVHDMTLHKLICSWSGNKTLLRLWLPLFPQVQRFVIHTRPLYFHDLNEVAEQHQPIVDVLREGNAEMASKMIQEHIMLVWHRINPELAAQKNA